MVRFLESQGFSIVRFRGSQHVMARRDFRTSVPDQRRGWGTRKLPPLLARIADLSPNVSDSRTKMEVYTK
jgi:hypothetical protein